jgi:hypothetical protein
VLDEPLRSVYSVTSRFLLFGLFSKNTNGRYPTSERAIQGA